MLVSNKTIAWLSDGPISKILEVKFFERNIVDIYFHALWVMGHNMTKQLAFPTIWELECKQTAVKAHGSVLSGNGNINPDHVNEQ